MIGQTIGNLRILSEIGRGGMGVVYLAENIKLPKKFAVKCLGETLLEDHTLRARFYREATHQALLDHPNIVRVVDYIEDHGQCFLIMDYVEGRDLKTILKSEGRLSEAMALAIIKGILHGLAAAHDKEIIHRDIKPSNILIDAYGQPHITDFGIAIIVDDTRFTQFDGIIGSANYISPEQVCSPDTVDYRSDIYATGILLFELLTGTVPYQGGTNYSIHYQHVHAPLPEPREKNPTVAARLAEILRHATEKKPSDRFQNCREFWDAIESYESSLKQLDRPKAPEFWRTIAPAALFAILIGALLLSYLGRSRFTQSQSDQIRADQSAFGLIRSASSNAMDICRYLEALAEKRSAFTTATSPANNVGSATIDMLQASIEAEEKRISDVTLEYNRTLQTLMDMEEITVEEQFQNVAHSLAQELSGTHLSYVQTLMRHYHQYQNGQNYSVPSFSSNDCVKGLHVVQEIVPKKK